MVVKRKRIIPILLVLLFLAAFTGCPPSYKDMSIQDQESLIECMRSNVNNMEAWDVWQRYSFTITLRMVEKQPRSDIICERVDGTVYSSLFEWQSTDGIGSHRNTWYINGMRYCEDRVAKKFWEEPGENPYENLSEALFPILQEALRYCFMEQELNAEQHSGYTMNGAPILRVDLDKPIDVLEYGKIHRIETTFTRNGLFGKREISNIGFILEEGSSIFIHDSYKTSYLVEDMNERRSHY